MTDNCALLLNAALENNLDKIKSCVEQDCLPLDAALDDEGKTILHIAVQKGYLELVEYIVEKTPQLILKADKEGNYPLHYAAENGYAEITLAILQADRMAINLLNKKNHTPFKVAVDKKDIDIVAIILRECGSIFRVNPLDVAIENDDGQMITKIIEICPELLDRKDQEGNAPLHPAINKAKAVSVKGILEANPKAIFSKNKDESTPLSPILREESQDVGEILEESDVTEWELSEIPKANLTDTEKTEAIRVILETHPQIIQVRNEGGKTLAHTVVTGQNTACRKLATEIFKKYPEAKFQQDNQGNTPLHIAIQNNNTQVAKTIIEQGIDILEIYNKAGKNPLHIATESYNYEIVKLILEVASFELVKKGTSNAERVNCLHIAAQLGYDDIVELILSKHQSLLYTQTATTKSTALHLAALYDHLEVIKVILRKSQDAIKLKDKDGLTPLDLAIKEDNLSTIKSILKYCKEAPSIQNTLVQTAAHSAVMFNKLKALKLILGSYPQTCDSAVKIKDSNGWTLLHHGAAQGHLAIVKHLVKEKAQIDDITSQQNSPLHLAACFGHNDVVDHLCSMGADINLKNQDGKTPIDNAIENGHPQVVRTILKESLKNDLYFIANSSKDILAKSIKSGHLEVVKSILEEILKNDPGFIANFGGELLARAIESGQVGIVYYLIAHKNIIHLKAMHLAIKSGHLNVIELLKEYGYEIDLTNLNGYTSAHLAAENGKLHVLTYLVTQDPGIINVKDSNLNSILHSAAVSEDLKTIQYLVKRGLDITASNVKGFTPLHLAAIFGRTNIVQFLTQQKQFAGNLDIKDSQGDTPLSLAVRNAHLKLVKMLLKQGANPNAQNNAGYRLIHLAVISNSTEMLNYLSDQGLRLDILSEDGLLPLHLAAIEGKVKMIQLFRKKGLDINQVDNEGLTPFDLAVKNGQLELVKWYLKECNDLNISSYNDHPESLIEKSSTEFIQLPLNKKSDNSIQNTPLHLAAQKGYLHAVKLLIERGAAINEFNKDKNTPLHLAVQNGHVTVVQELLSKEANTQLRNKAGQTPLDLAKAEGKQEIVDLLTIPQTSSQELIYETSPHKIKKNKTQKSTQSLVNKEVIELKTISENAIDIKTSQQNIDNTLDAQGNSPLHVAAMQGNTEKLKQLLDESETRSQINAQNKDGSTPLHLAVQNGHLNALDTLLKYSAENKQNKKGNNPLHFAAKSGNLEIAKLLLANGAEVKVTNKSGNSPLHLASHKGHQELVILFLENGAEINLPNNNGNNALHLAAQNGYIKVVESLLENGIDTAALNKESKTALKIAIESGHQEIVAILQNSIDTLAEKANKQEILESKEAFSKGIKHEITSNLHQANVTSAPSKMHMERPVDQAIRRGATLKESAFDLFKRGIDLHYAAKISYLDAIDTILKVGADINALNIHGQTPLYLAIFYDKYHSAQKLLKNGAKVEALYPHGFNLLHLAIHLDKSKYFIKLLIDHTTNIEAQDTAGNTAGHLATSKGRGDILSLILANKADINAKNKHGDTWLHVAMIYGYKNLINLLLDEGADIHALNFQGQTPLSLAVSYNKMGMVTELIKKGAKAELMDLYKSIAFCMPENFIISLVNTLDDVNVKGKDGYTFGHIASLYGLQKVLDFLLDKGANIHSLNDFGHTWLHMATVGGQNSTIQFLLARGAKEKAKDFAGNTPLHYAKTGETVKLLIESGADYSAYSRKKLTPLDQAILNSSPEVIAELIKYKPQQPKDYRDYGSLYNTSQDRSPIISKSKKIFQKSKQDNAATKSVVQFMKSDETSLKPGGITLDESHTSNDKAYAHTDEGEVKSLGEELDINT
ncbi:hypothetical protein phytr_9100 [Candidatus Phycorickettsia trachydisci]|uniref:Uncharacterized protein n=1 Tax=Candidatus Phycorickettsia trachydisci TaxID=2115978 RepID=A0A2P1P999_9RICK|nr:ankyrin repeat domain-containing protein [Candidatus Phycorickettsia trachydisci]AVP87839.1 hypothetical protein phytr_9100 [Candidatus Phycorickettsia trachydisci]